MVTGVPPMMFDWYGASVTDSPDHILSVCSDAFDMADLKRASPTRGYEQSVEVVRGSRRLCVASWGGNTGNRVLLEGSGESAAPVASLVRSEWPDHMVNRADVAEDFDEPEAFASLSHMMLSIADQFRLKTEHRGDWHRCENGRTLYIGSRQSPFYGRLYEKGYEQRSKGINPNASSDWVRLEIEVKPKRHQAKKDLASVEPDGFMAYSPWTREISRLLFDSSLEAVTGIGTIRRQSDQERALASLVRQYGNTLRGLRSEQGSWESVGILLGSLIDSSNG